MAGPALTNRWTVLVLLFFARAGMGMQFQSIPPIAPNLVAAWGIGYTEIGLLIGLFLFAGIALALPAGLLGQRFGDKPVISAGLALMTAGTAVFAAAPTYPVAFAGRLLSSFGVVLLNVQFTKVTNDWFAGPRVATAMAILMTSWPAGIAIGLSTVGFLAELAGWRVAVTCTVGYAALLLALFLLLYRDPPHLPAAPPGPAPFWMIERTELVRVSVAALVWMLPNAAFIIYLSFSPPLLMERGTPAALAALMTALASWISIASIPAGGVLTDRSGRIHTFIVAGLLGSALLTALHALSDAPWLLITLYGVSVGAWPGAIMSLPGRVLGPASRSTGFGVFYTTYYMGMVLLVPVGGWLQDATGTARAPLLLSAALMLAGVVALAALRLLLRRGAPAPAPEAA